MKNPLRDEGAALQVVVGTLAVALVIAGAAWLSPWLGGAVVLVLLGTCGWLGWRALAAWRR